MEWIVVTVIIALVGLFVTVGKPIINLNSNLVTLNINLQNYRKEQLEQKQAFNDQKKHSHESHQKLRDKDAEQDERINDHEVRIRVLEDKDV